MAEPESVFEVVESAPRPRAAFAAVADLPYSFWLDSASAPGAMARYSFIGARPYGVLESKGGVTLWRPEAAEVVPVDDPFAWLDDALDQARLRRPAPVPLAGGAVGWISYEMGDHFESLPPRKKPDHEAPDLHLAFFDSLVAWDHEDDVCWIISTGHPLDGAGRRARALARADETRGWLFGEAGTARRTARQATPRPSPQAAGPWLSSTHSPRAYARAVGSVVEAIERGDVYQVNLSQRFAASCEVPPARLYDTLRARNPAPYGACIRSRDTTVLSSSPERFLRIRPGGEIESRPIKGTRPRSEDPLVDDRHARDLRASSKDRAENLMIVDLMRNDLSRVCRPGSISVPSLFALESWATVHHLVSTVRGNLRPDVTPGAVLAATFPPGSVTGAPRIRAMELIARHELAARGPYCGAIGYFSFGGDVDLAVGIRIMVRGGHAAWFHAGGGIVADSDPVAEYEETLDKARALVETLEEERDE